MSKNFVSNKDESARIFKSDFLERFSKTHWSVPLIIFLPLIIFFVFNGLYYKQIGLSGILLFILGLFIWSFVEYTLHRFIFHYHPKTEWGRNFHWTFHGVHHDYPNDSKRLVMVPSVSLPLGALFYGIFYLIFREEYVDLAFAGLLSGYLAYDMIHYASHHAAFKNKFFLKLKQYHMKHHYLDPERGYGVSSFIWDSVFRTKFNKDM